MEIPKIEPQFQTFMNTIDMGNQWSSNSPQKKPLEKKDETLHELRTYASLMDQYSLHNFMIWNGKTLENTPEFQSFMRKYCNEWGYIVTIIKKLEELMDENMVKLAIINGQRVAELAMLNLSMFGDDQLLSCVANADKLHSQLNPLPSNEADQFLRAVIKIQTIARRWYAVFKYRALKRKLRAAILIQSIIRRFIQRCRDLKLKKNVMDSVDVIWQSNCKKLDETWNNANSLKKILIHIPSFNASEFVRLNMDHTYGLQNSHISCLHHLADPNVEIVYISPIEFGANELAYIDKFLNVMNINTYPRRLKFIVPDLVKRMPAHVPLAHLLWYSSSTLRKLKTIVSSKSCNVMLIPSDVGWAEKRIANFLNIPMLSPEPNVAAVLMTRSQSKRVFMKAEANIPIGAHDIYTEDDFLIALTRLIASNVDVRRWLIKLNTDFNAETFAYVDVDKMSLMATLRNEQAALIHTTGDPESWFERNVQLKARKRLLKYIQGTNMSIVKFCRPDMYNSWRFYVSCLKQYGAVIEAEPPNIRAVLRSHCFVHPLGKVSYINTVQSILNERFEVQASLYPQRAVPESAMEGACMSIANTLYDNWGIVGYVTIAFIAHWDALENMPRVVAESLHIGMNATFGAIGTLSVLIHPPEPLSFPQSLTLRLDSNDRAFVHIPLAVHTPLTTSRDDIFFRLSKMYGVCFDYERKTGVLFFLVDSIMGGAVSMIAIAENRMKAIDCAVHALTFISKNFGKEEPISSPPFTNLNGMLANMRYMLKKEGKSVPG